LRKFSGHLGTVQSVDLSTNGLLGVSGSRDGTMRLWDMLTEERFPTSMQSTSGGARPHSDLPRLTQCLAPHRSRGVSFGGR
jgi:WD40 repeat protein